MTRRQHVHEEEAGGRAGSLHVLIVHVVDTYDQFAGAEKVVLDLVKGLNQRDGVKVSAACNAGKLHESLSETGVHLYRLRRRGNAGLARELMRVVRGCDPDVVSVHHRLPAWLLSMVPRRRYRLATTFHVFPQGKAALTRYGDLAIPVARSLADDLQRCLGWRPHQMVPILNGISDEMFCEGKPRRKGERVTALVLGRLAEQKGHKYLLQALSSLEPKEQESFRLVVAGAGPLEEEIRADIAARELANCVELVGVQEPARMFAEADFLVMPSLWEGTPIALLEAWASGTAVLATRIPGIAELVKGEEALLVPPKDSGALANEFRRMVADAALRERVGKAGRRMYEAQFTLNHMIDNYERVFGELLRERVSA